MGSASIFIAFVDVVKPTASFAGKYSMLCKQHSDVDNTLLMFQNNVQFIVDEQLDKGINRSITLKATSYQELMAYVILEAHTHTHTKDNVLWNVLDNAIKTIKKRTCYRASQLERCAVHKS